MFLYPPPFCSLDIQVPGTVFFPFAFYFLDLSASFPLHMAFPFFHIAPLGSGMLPAGLFGGGLISQKIIIAKEKKCLLRLKVSTVRPPPRQIPKSSKHLVTTGVRLPDFPLWDRLGETVVLHKAQQAVSNCAATGGRVGAAALCPAVGQ
jgi:hypothetical protein